MQERAHTQGTFGVVYSFAIIQDKMPYPQYGQPSGDACYSLFNNSKLKLKTSFQVFLFPNSRSFGLFSHSNKGFGADRSSSKTHSPKVPK